jgi:hypothetical protein
MVDYPSLAVAPDGTLHLAWVQASLFGAKSTNGIFYSRSTDNGVTWSEPLKMAGDGDNLPKLALTSSQLHLLYTDQGNGIWHRWIALDQQNSSSQDWSSAARVPGWQGISPPFGLAVDGYTPGEAIIVGNRLHLVGASPALDLPVYSTWNNDRWSPIETFTLSAERKDRLGAVAATKATGGSLAVAWLAPSDQVGTQAKDLLFTIRSIPILEVPVVTPIPPTSTPEATSAPTLVPTKVPTPTPNLNRVAPPENDTVSPLALSGGAAALILAGVFFARWIFERTRS